MTTTSPSSVGTTPADDIMDNKTIAVPRFTNVPLKKGDKFSFVRFAMDDFESGSYFAGLTGKGVQVGVIDTGCDPNHPALKDRIRTDLSKNYLSDGKVHEWADKGGHGTHCAGIIAAEKKEGAPMFGIAPEADLVIYRTLGSFSLLTQLRAITKAIRDATKDGCRVISMSLGIDVLRDLFLDDSDQLYRACMEALAAGVTVVVAAGNSGVMRAETRTRARVNRSNTISPPGAFGGVITVASHDDRGIKSKFSSYGGELDFMAPGEVISTWPKGIAKGPEGMFAPDVEISHGISRGLPDYAALRGTSMACPLVAGLAALLIEAGDRASRNDTKGLSNVLLADLRGTSFRGRNCYEVREMLRWLSDHPDQHDRDTGYGSLKYAYDYVHSEVEADL